MKTQEIAEMEEIQHRLLQVARRMMASKRELQAEIREDGKKPEFRAIFDDLIRRNEERQQQSQMNNSSKQIAR